MAYDRDQFRDFTRRVLTRYKLHSAAAEELLLLTAAVESDFGTYLRQRGGGPAVGGFQHEPATFWDLRSRYGVRFPILYNYQFYDLEGNLELAILMARVKYMDDPDPLPPATDIIALAEYWKRVYNTPLGKGTVEKAVAKYNQYVATT